MFIYIAITTCKLISSVSLCVNLSSSVQAKVILLAIMIQHIFWVRGGRSPFWLLNSPTAGNTTGLFMKWFEGKSQWEVVTAGGERESCQQGVFSNMAYIGTEIQQKGKDALIFLHCILSLQKQARKNRENSTISVSSVLQYVKNDKLTVLPKAIGNDSIATNFPATCWKNNRDEHAQN